jgi:hypothetical protein
MARTTKSRSRTAVARKRHTDEFKREALGLRLAPGEERIDPLEGVLGTIYLGTAPDCGAAVDTIWTSAGVTHWKTMKHRKFECLPLRQT